MGGFSKTGADFTLSKFFLLKQESRYLHKPNSLISDHCRLVGELLFLAVLKFMDPRVTVACSECSSYIHYSTGAH